MSSKLAVRQEKKYPSANIYADAVSLIKWLASPVEASLKFEEKEGFRGKEVNSSIPGFDSEWQ